MKIPEITTAIIISLGCWAFFPKSSSDENFIESSQKLSVPFSSNTRDEIRTDLQTQVQPNTMDAIYQIRFVSEDGGVALFVNGFLVFSEKDEGRIVSKLSSFIKPGVNTFELIPNNADKNATLNLVDVSNGADPQTTPILLTLSTEEAAGASIIGNFTVESDTADFKWHDATEITNVEAAADEIYAKLEALAKALETGPDEELIALLDLKHKEIATVFGITKEQMDSGIIGGLEDKRTDPKFSIDLVKRENFIPLTAKNGAILNAMRTDGNHAIRIMDDYESPGFSVSLAKIEGEFVIVR